jgi:oligoribonuclease NrnB/cAMP/cGMP phosphodiesterase (DHH superfamily)
MFTLDKDCSYNFIFNGDADGIFSALQFILDGFIVNELFTGVKRDQSLLRYANNFKESNILVFDLELAKNENYLNVILENRCKVVWFDHHGNYGLITMGMEKN